MKKLHKKSKDESDYDSYGFLDVEYDNTNIKRLKYMHKLVVQVYLINILFQLKTLPIKMKKSIHLWMIHMF